MSKEISSFPATSPVHITHSMQLRHYYNRTNNSRNNRPFCVLQTCHGAPPPAFAAKLLFPSNPVKSELGPCPVSFLTPPTLEEKVRAPFSDDDLADIDVTSYTTDLVDNDFTSLFVDDDSDLLMTSSASSLMKPTVLGKRKPKESTQVRERASIHGLLYLPGPLFVSREPIVRCFSAFHFFLVLKSLFSMRS